MRKCKGIVKAEWFDSTSFAILSFVQKGVKKEEVGFTQKKFAIALKNLQENEGKGRSFARLIPVKMKANKRHSGIISTFPGYP